MPVGRSELWAWHLRPGALERSIPPWSGVRVEESGEPSAEGARRVLSVPAGPLRLRWVALHRAFDPPQSFEDVQERGPFASWRHTHRCLEGAGGAGSLLEDVIRYELPLGRIGRAFAGPAVRRRLERTFRHRHAITAADLARHAARTGRVGRSHVAISGASGLVGAALGAFLTAGGHRVSRLVRGEPRGEDEIGWDPRDDSIEAEKLEGVDALVHLAGENIAGGRWSAGRKRRIRESRVRGTRLLAATLASLSRRPAVLVSASALGYYGDRGDETLDESSAPGAGFLAQVCREWEAATEPAERAGIRVVRLRIGLVLSAAGGALGTMLPLFRAGLGGRLGDGRQFISWIAHDDLIGVIHHALIDDSLRGPVNAVAPQPVRNAEFTRTLGRVLRRPTVLPAPAAALRLALGEMANELLLSSTRLAPRALAAAGFEPRFSRLEPALRFELGRFLPERGIAIDHR